MSYLHIIRTSVVLFPLVALGITIPYMIFTYHRYGSLNVLRTLIVYSFVLYLESAFFLVVLPLPDPGTVVHSYTHLINLHPLRFLELIRDYSPLNIHDPSTWRAALHSSYVYVPLFNVLMLIPFGMYLHYYFGCGFWQTVFLSFLLSAFFEFTQLTGLFFYYPGSYRHTDVDDLIQNTLGGAVGYVLVWPLMALLPSRAELDARSYKKGEKVSGLRRTLGLMIDIALILGLGKVLERTLSLPFADDLVFVLYFGLVPLFSGGRTIGSAVLGFYHTFSDRPVLRSLIRAALMWVYFYGVTRIMLRAMAALQGHFHNYFLVSGFFSAFVFLVLYGLFTLVVLLSARPLPFDHWMGITYVSSIRRPGAERNRQGERRHRKKRPRPESRSGRQSGRRN